MFVLIDKYLLIWYTIYNIYKRVYVYIAFASLTGAWIEILNILSMRMLLDVEPLTGEKIEINVALRHVLGQEVPIQYWIGTSCWLF